LTKDYIQISPVRKVAFDIGNVLFHFDLTPLLDLLIGLNIVENTSLAYEFMGGSFQHSQEIGLYDIKQSFYQLNPHLSNKTLQDIHDRWMETFSPSLPMIDLVEELIGNNYDVALLSNIGPDHAYFVRDNCKIFNKCIQHFSCDVGARKPTRLFFQSFLINYGWGREVKYFDDRQDNITMGNEYHNGILFDINNFRSDEEAAKNMRTHLSLA
jgi:FMN phosphatase YigB (HAD superfamily)